MFNLFAHLMRDMVSLDDKKSRDKALANYFKQIDSEDLTWTIYFLLGKKYKKLSSSTLKKLFIKYSNMDESIFNKCYGDIGEVGDTIALMMEPKESSLSDSLSRVSEKCFRAIGEIGFREKTIFDFWSKMDRLEVAVFNKILTGTLKQKLDPLELSSILENIFQIDRYIILERVLSDWEPASFYELLSEKPLESIKKEGLYPFSKPNILKGPLNKLEERAQWYVHGKYNGVMVQIVKRGGEVSIWSKGFKKLNVSFPEMVEKLKKIKYSFVAEGELVSTGKGIPNESGKGLEVVLERLGRKRANSGRIRVIFYDIFEFEGEETVSLKLRDRLGCLEKISKGSNIEAAQGIEGDWTNLEEFLMGSSRNESVDGLFLKKLSSLESQNGLYLKRPGLRYANLVLIYANPTEGSYTLGIFNPKGDLIPLVKINKVPNVEELNLWIRGNTLEKFGPVRMVDPKIIFRISFEGVIRSPRKKSGLILRSPWVVKKIDLYDSEILTSLDELKR